MERRLVKKFNELYFKNIVNASKALSIDFSEKDLNEKSAEVCDSKNKELLAILSDLLQIKNKKIIEPYSEVLLNISWDKSKANIIFQTAFTDFPESVKEVASELSYLSDESYFVGGSVRDVLIGKNPKDFDFVTDVDYDLLKNHFEKVGYTVQEKGKEFLVLIISKNGNSFEIANFRKESTYSDGRRPDKVSIGTIDDDSGRRDFSVNNLYVNTKTLKIKDPSGYGIDDINSRILRFIGNPKNRIKEDFLRGWRFYRFIKKGFTPDKKSLKAVRENWNEIYEQSNPERVRNELEKMCDL